MGKSPGKWIKTVLFGKKSSKSNLSKDATLDRKNSVTSKAPSKDFNDDSMVISSPVLPPSVNPTNDAIEVVRSATWQNTANVDELITLEQAAIKAQAAFRGYLARREFLALKAVIRLQALVRGYLLRRRVQAKLEGNLVIITKQPEQFQVPPLEDDILSNGKENHKTRRRRSFPAKQGCGDECGGLERTPVLPSYMAATESANAKLRAQAAAKAAEDGGENGFVRRHSLPSAAGKLSLDSPRVQKPLQTNGKGWSKSNKQQICARDDKMLQTGWKR